ncbi:MAG: hypothetical protein MI923_20770 [Phycisphaerales bacterium]|nr:hypothetical protein [Phycisphaerales bacterium]
MTNHGSGSCAVLTWKMNKIRNILLFLVFFGIASCSQEKSRQYRVSSSAVARDFSDRSLRNVFPVAKDVFSGSQPEGDAGFDALLRMGVRTVISVDGAKPDLMRARARRLRYVHVPIGYRGIRPRQQRLLAKAIRDLPKPLYLHCHHGRHRGPTAAALAAFSLGWMDRKQAVDFMEKAGTSAHYSGLYACVERASAVPPEVLEAMSSDFPEVAQVSGIAKTMSEIEHVFTHLRKVRAAGWKSPEDHPDLVPAAEAARLFDLFRNLRDDPTTSDKPEAFARLLNSAIRDARTFEDAVTSDRSDRLDAGFEALELSCRNCHAQYRD